MLYHLSLFLKNSFSFFNIVHYVSFRVMASLLTSLILSFIFGAWFIKKSDYFRAKARQYTPDTHQAKNDTPTMGGIFVLFATTVTGLLWCNLAKLEVWIFLFCLIGFGLIGFWDDFSKIVYKKGISESKKFIAQILVSASVMIVWYFFVNTNSTICVPFFKNFNPDLSYFLIPWGIFILTATSNAVNLTDGLDGLAISSLILNFSTFSIITYLASNINFSTYLNIPYLPISEISILGAALVGSSIGFLWYNCYPAQVFMGDVGSLAFGAALALMAIMARQELLLVLAAGLFIAETLSVIAQVFSFKYFKRRIFKMAPLHHHFELLGWPETKITIRFGIITLILSILTLMTLKIR